MNEPPESAWYFTRQGERFGPVTFNDLRTQARETGLNPRLDMVWKQGMAEWKPSGEVEGLFEKRAAPEAQESLAQAASPYEPPKTDSAAEIMAREGGWPGARRRVFLLVAFLFPFLWNFLFALGAPFIAQQFGARISGVVIAAAPLVLLIVVVYFSLQRLVNLGMSRWWYLGNFVPILNLWVGYRCFACPAGYAYHKKLDGAGIALAILYWLLVVIGILVLVSIVALMFGAVGNPELQDRIREILHSAQERFPKP